MASNQRPLSWKRTLAIQLSHGAILRVVPAVDLKPALPSMLAFAQDCAADEKVDVRQPACHALARIAAAMAQPDKAGTSSALAEGGSLDELAEAAAAAVPSIVRDALCRCHPSEKACAQGGSMAVVEAVEGSSRSGWHARRRICMYG